MKSASDIGLKFEDESDFNNKKCTQDINYFSEQVHKINNELISSITRIEQKIELLRQIYDNYKNEKNSN